MNDEQFHRSIRECVRCGSCKTICPTYESQKDETMSGRGRIAILNGILSGEIQPSRGALARVFSCIQCSACAKNCPPGIDIPEVIYAGRNFLRKYAGSDRLLRSMTKVALRYSDLCFGLLQISRKPVNKYLKRKYLIPENYNIPDKSLKNLPQVISPRQKKGRVAVFKGCSTNYFFPHLGRSLVHILLKCGYEVVLPKAEVCCGVPFRTLGMEKEAIISARKNIEIFGRIKAEAVISLCPTCILALKNEYPLLINKGVENAMDISSFIKRQKNSIFKNPIDVYAFYHDPCHMLYGLNIKEEPREVLNQCGISLVDNCAHSCCGFGGTYSIKFGDSSLKQARARRYEIEKTNARAVFTSCPGCMLQLKKVMGSIDVFHIVEAIEKAMS